MVVANIKIVHFCVFFLVLILCHEILCVEARRLKSKHCKHCSKNMKVKRGEEPPPPSTSSSYVSSTQGAENNNVKIDDFGGPTGPGHSPGIGHSIHN